MSSEVSPDLNIRELSRHIYITQNEKDGAPFYSDQSHSSNCDKLSLTLYNCLQARGIPGRREYHADDRGNWHYLIAYGQVDTTPTESDIITDLNPWQWTSDARLTGPLHGPRADVMERLETAGAPDFFIALRGIQTIAMPHRLPR